MTNFIKDRCNKDNLVKIFTIFLILQPLLDTYILFEEKTIQIFKISPSTVIRLIFVFLLCLISIFVIKSKKQWKCYILYVFLVTLYCVFHFYNATKFSSFTPGNFNYSITSELFYIIRMLIPLIIIIISSNIKFNTISIKRIVNILVVLISGTIVFTNIFKISIGAYITKIIHYNIFDWFTSDLYTKYTFYDTATRAYFSFANMISALLFGLTALLFYQLFKKFNFKNALLIIIQMLAMFMLGTKVSTFGFLLSTIVMIIAYLFFIIVKKELKLDFRVITFIACILICWILIYPVSPCQNRINGTKVLEETHEREKAHANSEKMLALDKLLNGLEDSEKGEIVREFVKENYEDFAIKEEYVLNKYPYQYDAYFWYTMMKQPYYKKTDNRFLLQSIYDRLIDLNKRNQMDNLFGLTYSRTSNIGVLERDFLSQYYSLGIVGLTLIVLPYIFILFVSSVYMILNYKSSTFKIKNVSLIICLVSGFVGSYYCGNVLDNLTFTIIYSFLLGQLIRSVFIDRPKRSVNENEVTILALHLGVGGVEKYISSLCKMLKSNYKVKIISTYKVSDKPAFDFSDVEISYLILDRPYVEEMKQALKNKKILLFIKLFIKNIKIYILRYIRNIKAVKGINSKYVITTRTFHNNIVNYELDYNYVKIATEHNYHNNNNKYVRNLVESISNFDYLVCVSNELKEYYEKRVSNAKVVYIPNTIDDIPNIKNKKFTKNLISVGRFSSEKGFLDLLDVFKIVNSKDRNVHLTLIGDGEESSKIKEKIRDLDLNNYVELTGYISNRDELSKYYDNSSIYVMTSYTESFGIVLIEAMSFGLACIAFDSANGAKQLLKENGILISDRNKEKMANEILKLLKDSSKLKELGKLNYNYSKNFKTDVISKEWLGLLGEK